MLTILFKFYAQRTRSIGSDNVRLSHQIILVSRQIVPNFRVNEDGHPFFLTRRQITFFLNGEGGHLKVLFCNKDLILGERICGTQSTRSPCFKIYTNQNSMFCIFVQSFRKKGLYFRLQKRNKLWLNKDNTLILTSNLSSLCSSKFNIFFNKTCGTHYRNKALC
jgi:hypothetical protein